ncbi:MAG: hypothetical protein U0869_04065 [Chloroflexota bacterium]
MSDLRSGSGPLADRDIVTGGPIDDPAMADRNNPRWAEDPSAAAPDATPLGGPGDTGTDVEPPATIPQLPGDLPDPQGDPLAGPDTFAATGTPQDQAAQPLEGELDVGRDNIREGRGDVVPNPALAEGGDNG